MQFSCSAKTDDSRDQSRYRLRHAAENIRSAVKLAHYAICKSLVSSAMEHSGNPS